MDAAIPYRETVSSKGKILGRLRSYAERNELALRKNFNFLLYIKVAELSISELARGLANVPEWQLSGKITFLRDDGSEIPLESLDGETDGTKWKITVVNVPYPSVGQSERRP